MHGRMAGDGHGLLKVSLGREGKGEKRKGKGGGEGMGVCQGVATDYFKYRYGLPCLTHVCPAGSHQEKGRV
jgi:hypothetical protein